MYLYLLWFINRLTTGGHHLAVVLYSSKFSRRFDGSDEQRRRKRKSRTCGDCQAARDPKVGVNWVNTKRTCCKMVANVSSMNILWVISVNLICNTTFHSIFRGEGLRPSGVGLGTLTKGKRPGTRSLWTSLEVYIPWLKPSLFLAWHRLILDCKNP